MLFKYRLERPPEISSRDISKHSQTDGPIKKRDLIATAAARLRNMVRGGGQRLCARNKIKKVLNHTAY